jgi:hypothetical protein
MYVARQSFRDPSDGDWVEAGRTFVSSQADVYRLFPERFELARSSHFDGAIGRVGGSCAVKRSRSRNVTAPSSVRRPTEHSPRPSWLLDEPRPSWRL